MTLLKTFEFKGNALHPFTEGRKILLLSLMTDEDIPKLVRMYASIFALACDEKTAKAAFCNQGKFIQAAMEWGAENIDKEDYEEIGNLIKSVVEHSDSTKAEPIEDPNLLPDPTSPN